MDSREILREYLLRDALGVYPEEITLRSGQKSRYIWDIKKISMLPLINKILGELFWEKLKIKPPEAIGGPATGAIPLIDAVSHTAFLSGYLIRAFYIEKEPRLLPLDPWISGNLNPRDEVVLLEDVVTTGGSVKRCMKLLPAANKVIQILSVVDRRPESNNGDELFGIAFCSLFKHRDLIMTEF